MSQVKRGREWSNEGPAHQEGSLGVLTPNMASGGGVERRQVWDALHDASAEEAREARLAGSRQSEAERLESSRRGGEATRQKHPWRSALPAVVDPPVIPPEEEPAMPEPSSTPVEGRNASPAYNAGAEFEGDVDDGYEPSGDSLEDAMAVMADALVEAMEARGAMAKAVRRWTDARQALEACWEATGLGPDVEPPDHLPVQEIELGDGTVMRAHSDGAPETIAALRELGEVAVAKLHDEARASVALDGETQAADWRGKPIPPAPESAAQHNETMPVAAPIAATGGGPGRPAYVQRMLDALVAVDGDFTAAAKTIGVKRTSLVGSMSKLRARTDLTEAERAVVARKRGAR